MKTPIAYKDSIIIENDFNCDGRSIDEGIYTVMEFRDKEEVNVSHYYDIKFVYFGPCVSIQVDDSYEDDDGEIVENTEEWFIPYDEKFCRLILKNKQLEFNF